MFKVPEQFRVKEGPMRSSEKNGNNGCFIIEYQFHGIKQKATAIASDGGGWEHVSVSRRDRCLTWEEMCIVKNMFWSTTDCVVQFHPPESEYVNVHKNCLHLWRCATRDFPMPPKIMV